MTLKDHHPAIESGMRLIVWAHQLGYFPTLEQVKERFGVSRDTAYRWRHSLGATLGVTPPNLQDPPMPLAPLKRRGT